MIRAHLRSGVGTSILIALLVAVTVFVVAVAPRALMRLGSDELRYELRSVPTARVDLSATGSDSFVRGSSATEVLGPIDETVAALPSHLPEPLADGAGKPAWLVRALAVTTSSPGDVFVVLRMQLAVDLHWADRVRLVEGSEPRPWAGDGGAAAKQVPPIEIALAAQTAEAMSLHIGDVIPAAPVPYRLAETYEATDSDDAYWQHARDLLAPALIRESGAPLKIQASAYVDPESAVHLTEALSAGEISAWVPLDPGAYNYSDGDELATQARHLTATPVQLPNGGQLGFRSSFDEVVGEAQSKVSAMSALIALSASGFVGVLIGAYALCIQALIRRRATVLTLASSRGAGAGQLRLIMMLEAALISVPVSIAAILAAAVLLPEAVTLDGWLAPAVVALIPVALAGFLTRASAFRRGRDDVDSRWDGTTRWVVELGVLAMAGIAAFLLQRRGLVASSAAIGIDPLLSAMPVLLATAAGLLVLRLYPLPLRAFHRAIRSRRAAAASVGSARAIREPAVGLVGTLALVIGISVAVFGTAMISTVAHGLHESAREQIGADLRVSAHDLPAELVDALDGLPSIAAAVALASDSGVEFSDETGPTEVTVLLADTRALHLVRPDIPELTGKTDGRLPILISSDWADRVDGTELSVVNSEAVRAGVIPANAIPGLTRHWILVDASAKAEIGLDGLVADRLLLSVADGARPADAVAEVTRAVTAEQPDQFADTVRVEDVDSLLAHMRAAPVTSGLEASLVVTAVAALILTMLIVALSALTAGAARGRVVGVLRVLGMSRRQIRSLVGWEFGPVAAGAVVVGAGLGLALPYLVTAVLDLRSYFGGTSLPQPALEPAWIAGSIAAFVIAVAASVVVATAAGRRIAPARVLKMGEE
jgi:putative ABC transport system permease protein